MTRIKIQYHKTTLGEFILGSHDNSLCLLDWRYRKMRKPVDDRIKRYLNADFEEGNSDVVMEAKNQVNEYIDGKRKEFKLPLSLAGSDFQKQVWQELMKIPFGKTISYLELSRKTGNKLAIRAVASANGTNALALVVPCHRVIGSNGELTGYAGGLNVKKRLLMLESESAPVKQLEMMM